MSRTGKVYAVDDVSVRISKTHPAWLVLHANGRTATTGWSGGQLSQYVYVIPPADGVQEFDLIADRPPTGTAVLDVLTPISARAELENVAIDDYWAPGRPLKGIRVHAVSNAKSVEVHSREAAAELAASMSPAAVAAFIEKEGAGGVPSFVEDIKPLFRERDVIVMEAVGGFNLHKYEDVKANAEKILERLKIDMPCDGLWPQSDIDKFAAWRNGGMPA